MDFFYLFYVRLNIFDSMKLTDAVTDWLMYYSDEKNCDILKIDDDYRMESFPRSPDNKASNILT